MSAPLASDTRSPFQGHAAAKEAVALEGTGQATPADPPTPVLAMAFATLSSRMPVLFPAKLRRTPTMRFAVTGSR